MLTRLQWLGVALVAAAAAAAVTALVPRHHAARRPVQTRIETRLTPATHVFGDPVDAQVDVTPDAAHARERVSVDASFVPYRVVSARRSTLGPTVRFTYRLECLGSGCAPAAPERRLAFAPVHVHVGVDTATVPWPALTVASRLTPADLSHPALRASGDLAEAGAGGPFHGAILGWPLAALAAALAMVGLASLAARPDDPVPAAGPSPTAAAATPRERALGKVEASLSGDALGRRRALELLAAVLDEEDDAELAREARRLAWAEEEPAPAEVQRLAAAARETRRAA